MKKTAKAKDGCVMPLHFVVSNALSSGTFAFALSPSGIGNSSTRLQTEADCWAHFKWLKFKFRLRSVNSVTANTAAGFVGGLQDTPPTTVLQVAELLPSCVIGGDETVPTEWIEVRKEDLAGPFPWYKSLNGAADPTEEAPGQICVGGNATDNFLLECRGIVEFKTAVAPANTPAAIKLREQVRKERIEQVLREDRAELVRLLGGTPVVVPAAAAPTSGQKLVPPKEAGCGMPYLKPDLCQVQGCPYHTKP